MGHAELTRAVGRLFYRTSVRRAFFDQSKPPCAGLDSADLRTLAAIDQARLQRVVELHRSDIWCNWYQPYVPATWTALCTALNLDGDQVVERLTDSLYFDQRVNDDATCAALSRFIDSLIIMGELRAAEWLPSLLEYELMLCGRWHAASPWTTDGDRFYLFRFDWEIEAICSSLLDGMFPEDEPVQDTWLLFAKEADGFAEVAIDPRLGPVLTNILDSEPAPEGVPAGWVTECNKILAGFPPL